MMSHVRWDWRWMPSIRRLALVGSIVTTVPLARAEGQRETAAWGAASTVIAAGLVDPPPLSEDARTTLTRQCDDWLGPWAPDRCETYKLAQAAELYETTAYVSAFRLDRTEVSRRDYATCVAVGKCNPGPLVYSLARGEDEPVTDVTWEEASQYCDAHGGALPTVRQWQRAVGAAVFFPKAVNLGAEASLAARWGIEQTGPDWDMLVGAPDEGDGYLGPSPVRAMPWSFVGETLHLVGNVAEWVHGPTREPDGPREVIDPGPVGARTDGRSRRVVGGSWRQSPALGHPRALDWLEALYDRNGRYAHIGFRCAYRM